jgi:hypothetical protein
MTPPATAYVVKTADEGEAGDPQAATMPMSTFVPPPAPSSSQMQYFPSGPPASQAGPPTGYQGYVPGASSRREGAAYMPYSAATASALEKPRESRSFLMPVIVGAVVALLALAAFSGWLVVNSQNKGPLSVTGNSKAPSPVPTAAPQPTKVPANAPDQDKVKEVVRVSNDEQIQAWKNLDENVLKGTRIGKVLDEQLDMVKQLKQNGMYAVPVNVELAFLDVQVKGDQATVRTKEVWTVTFYRKSDNRKIESKGPDTLTETYYLTKQNGKWLINNLVFNSENGVTPTPGGD